MPCRPATSTRSPTRGCATGPGAPGSPRTRRGRPLGVLHGTRVQKLPSAHRPADAWFHVSLLFVTQDARGLRHRAALLEALLRGPRPTG